jgi:hypothetical protein
MMFLAVNLLNFKNVELKAQIDSQITNETPVNAINSPYFKQIV